MRRHDWLAERPFTLVLSAGFFGFFSHTGLLIALHKAGLRPRRVVGVSAGALAGGLYAAGLAPLEIRDELAALRRSDFWDPGFPLGGVLRGKKFRAKLCDVLARSGVRSIEDCPTPFSAVAHDVVAHRPLVFERGPLDLAIRASCTVPFMFRPILDQGRILVDGGVSDRSGLSGLGQDERVLLHYLPSRRRLPFRTPAMPKAPPTSASLTVVTPDLPSVTPMRLEHGPVALDQTQRHIARWLNDSLNEGQLLREQPNA